MTSNTFGWLLGAGAWIVGLTLLVFSWAIFKYLGYFS